MPTRILIANRGEIAVRVIHACHDTGRTAIAVFADVDCDALFVRLADEAYALEHIGVPASESPTPDPYLDIRRIVAAALASHADAVHPGYGFLSENADLAQAVIDAGLTWIGPSPSAIRTLGSKVEARRIAAEVGAPMAPGTAEPVSDPRQVVGFARRYGLPVAIKAVHGGGGRGLKVVRAESDIVPAFSAATREARLAFGDGSCFLERFLDRPRHVEVQVLGDRYGDVVAVGTRDCSLQRRNQKLIEEAPAPFLPEDVEEGLRRAAVAICRRVGYEGAGTVEFLVDRDGSASFMEVNTRIQVEHPVTEQTCGVDLVQAQFALAEGAHVADVVGSAPAVPVGHAIEFRITAEDPARGFVPFPGTVASLRLPSGPGIRVDTGVESGSVVSGRYDSLLAKLIVTAPTRKDCLRRARRALEELEVDGVPTVRAFDLAVLDSPDFVAEDGHFGVYTRWIEEVMLPAADPARLSGGVAGERAGEPRVREGWIGIDGRRVRLAVPDGLFGLPATDGPATAPNDAEDHAEDGPSPDADGAVAAPMTGVLVRWTVDDGGEVSAGDTVAVVEAMKMETPVTAPSAGVLRHRARAGDEVRYRQAIGLIG